MEDWFCNEVKSRDYEDFIGRQIPTVSGRLDVLSYKNPDDGIPLSLNLYELKNDKIRYKDLTQILYYKNELLNIILSFYDVDDCVASFVYKDFSSFITSYLIGTGITNKAKRMIKPFKRQGVSVKVIEKDSNSFNIEKLRLPHLSQSKVNGFEDDLYFEIAKTTKEYIKEYLGGIRIQDEVRKEVFEEYINQ